MNKKLLVFILTLLLLLFGVSYAQPIESITATINKSKILIGEQLQLKITTRHSATINNKLSIPNTIPHFEIMGEPVIDSTVNNEYVIINRTYTLSSFDSGSWMIPPFSLSKKLQSKPIKVDVVFSDFNPEQPYHDIKNIIEVEETSKQTPWWLYAVGLLMAGLLLGFFIKKKKKFEPKPDKVLHTADAYKQAMERLSILQQRVISKKEFYAALTDIFREYMFNKKGILSLQKTTDDLLLQLKKTNLQANEFAKLSQALQTCDFVKFAKYAPSKQEDEMVFETIRQTIVFINNN